MKQKYLMSRILCRAYNAFAYNYNMVVDDMLYQVFFKSDYYERVIKGLHRAL